MDYETVRRGLEQAIPYNRYLELEVAEVADGRASSGYRRTSGTRAVRSLLSW